MTILLLGTNEAAQEACPRKVYCSWRIRDKRRGMTVEVLKNFVGGDLVAAEAEEKLEVLDPATEELLGRVPLSGEEDVEKVVRAASEAFRGWREEPVTQRARRMFRLQVLLEEHLEELAEVATRENGKHFEESEAEIRRGIEVVELAASMTTLIKGETLDQVSRGVDVALYREPLGVVTAITPFNFPMMIPLWFAPLAIATGNAFILKPSQRTPLSAMRLADLSPRPASQSGSSTWCTGPERRWRPL